MGIHPATSDRRWLRLCYGVLTIGALVSPLRSAEPPATKAPLFDEAAAEFKAMTVTLYQHKTEVDRAAGSFKYDCVGFVSYALKHAAPKAWDSVFTATGIAKGRIPTPAKYQQFFASLSDKPQPG